MPWARRREVDLTHVKDKTLAKIVELAEKIPAEAFEKHGFERAGLVQAVKEIQGVISVVITEFGKLPDDFPPAAVRRTAPKGFSKGSQVQLRANRKDKYKGAFDVDATLTVGEAEIGGGYIPVTTPLGQDFFVAAAHLMHVPTGPAA